MVGVGLELLDGVLGRVDDVDVVPVLAQNIGELVNSMKDCGLVSVTEEGPTSRVAITEAGLEILETVRPGWQIQQVDQDAPNRRLDARLAAVLQELQWLAHEQHDSPSRTRDTHTSGKFMPGLIIECKRWDSPAKRIKHSEISKRYRHKLYKDHIRSDVRIHNGLSGAELIKNCAHLQWPKFGSQS